MGGPTEAAVGQEGAGRSGRLLSGGVSEVSLESRVLRQDGRAVENRDSSVGPAPG